jgi:hypothetical protein
VVVEKMKVTRATVLGKVAALGGKGGRRGSGNNDQRYEQMETNVW